MSAAHEGILDSLKTGDLVLLAPAPPAPWLPGWLGGRRWKHVALVIRDDQSEPMILETAPAGAASSGVRLRRLVKRLATHSGRISVRRLNRALSSAQCERLDAWRREIEGRQRRRSLMDLMGAGEDGWLAGEPAALGTPLPGELVAEAFQRIGLLDGPGRGLPARAYTPQRFAEREDLRLKQGYELRPEVRLDRPELADTPEKLTALPA